MPEMPHACPGFGPRPPHGAAFAEMVKNARRPAGVDTYCKACLAARHRARYRDDGEARARQLACNKIVDRRRRLIVLASLPPTRYRLGVVVGLTPRRGSAPVALVVTADATLRCFGPAGLSDGEFVAVRTRRASPHRPRGRRHSRTVHRARPLAHLTRATGERLLALQRAWLWEHALTPHDRDGMTPARQFAGIDLLLARAEGDARRHRKLTEAQDAQDAEAQDAEAQDAEAQDAEAQDAEAQDAEAPNGSHPI